MNDPVVIQTPTNTEHAAKTEPQPPAEPTPPWGTDENFNPETAWKLIQNLKADKASLQAKLTQPEDPTPQGDEANPAAEEPAATEQVEAEKPEAKKPATETKEEPAKPEPAEDLEATNKALRMELAKTKALASTNLPQWAEMFLPDGTDEEIGQAVTKLLELTKTSTASHSLPPANPAQAAGNPEPPSKDDLAREFFAGLGLN